jgi:hypothetical protein
MGIQVRSVDPKEILEAMRTALQEADAVGLFEGASERDFSQEHKQVFWDLINLAGMSLNNRESYWPAHRSYPIETLPWQRWPTRRQLNQFLKT